MFIRCRLCIEDKLAAIKTQIRHILSLKDVFEPSVVDDTLQSIVHHQLQTNFNPYDGIFNYSEDVRHKHCNRTKEVFTILLFNIISILILFTEEVIFTANLYTLS